VPCFQHKSNYFASHASQATLKKKKKKARGGKVQIWLFDASQWPEMLDRVEKRILW
jgi:hypothetical protein